MLFLQCPRRGSPVVRRTDPAGPGFSECTTIRSGLQTCLGAHNERLQQRASGAKRVCCKPGLCSGPYAFERETTLVEDSRRAWVEPTGESPAATRAVVGALIEGTIAEGATRTERNPALDRPGAWALLGRARVGRTMEPEPKQRTESPEERRPKRGAAGRAKRRGAWPGEMAMQRCLPRSGNVAADTTLSAPNPSLQRPRRGFPVVRRAGPARSGISKCTPIRRGLLTFCGPHNRGRQRRARRSGASPLHAGLGAPTRRR